MVKPNYLSLLLCAAVCGAPLEANHALSTAIAALAAASTGVIGGKKITRKIAEQANVMGAVSVQYQLNLQYKDGTTKTESRGDCSGGIFEGQCVVTVAHCFGSVNLRSLGEEKLKDLDVASVGIDVAEDGDADGAGPHHAGDIDLRLHKHPTADIAVFKLQKPVGIPTFRLSDIPDEDPIKEGTPVGVIGSGPDKLENERGNVIKVREEFKGAGERRGVFASVGPTIDGIHWLAPREVPATATAAEKLRAKFWTGPGDSGGLVVSTRKPRPEVLGINTSIHIANGSGFLSLSGERKLWLKEKFKKLGCGT